MLFSFHSGGKEITEFAHPIGGAAPNGDNDQFRYNLQIGSFKAFVQDVEGVAEQFHRLRTAITILDRDNKSIDITPYAFRSNKAIFAINLEKTINEEDEDLGMSGQSTKNGSQATLLLKDAPRMLTGPR